MLTATIPTSTTPSQVSPSPVPEATMGSSKPPPHPYSCEFMPKGALLPFTEGVRPCAYEYKGEVAKCMGKALLLP